MPYTRAFSKPNMKPQRGANVAARQITKSSKLSRLLTASRCAKIIFLLCKSNSRSSITAACSLVMLPFGLLPSVIPLSCAHCQSLGPSSTQQLYISSQSVKMLSPQPSPGTAQRPFNPVHSASCHEAKPRIDQRRLKITPKTLNHRCPSFLSRCTTGRRTQSRPATQLPSTEKPRQRWRQPQMSCHSGRQSLSIYLPLPVLPERLNQKRHQNAECDKHCHAAAGHQQTKQKNQKIKHTYLQKRDIQIIAAKPPQATKRLRITRSAGRNAPIIKSSAMTNIAKRILTKTFIFTTYQKEVRR